MSEKVFWHILCFYLDAGYVRRDKTSEEPMQENDPLCRDLFFF